MSLTRADSAAHEALKARLGKGARYDAPNAPADDLLLARRGTAYFARKLAELTDDGLFEPSAVAGISRVEVVARVSYEARYQALALEALNKGEALELPEELPSLHLASTLPARALRHLFQHSEVHLNVCWRDLAENRWDSELTLANGTRTTPRAMPMPRARGIWQGALDLGSGARAADVPPGLQI